MRNAHRVPIRRWLIGASREGVRTCKLLPKQLATGELLIRPGPDEKFRIRPKDWICAVDDSNIHRADPAGSLISCIDKQHAVRGKEPG